ncbi:MAG: glycine cleavage system aminomethyltransferase GcvT [Flavobacteriaceae bacterium]
MKTTPFFDIHNQLGAKMALFGGYQMPIQYGGVKVEHLAVRENLGVFDVSHMGEFIVEGDNAASLLQFLCSNDIAKLKTGKAQYNYLPNATGGVVDDLIVYQLKDQEYLLVVNASNIEKDWNHLLKHNQNFNANIRDVSDDTALLAIQGPQAVAAMDVLFSSDLKLLSNYSHTTTTFAGVEDVLVATTGYTGAGGIEIYFPATEAVKVWNAVMEAGDKYGILPIGLAARDTLRLEMGYCLYGNEINDETCPISAGLGWVTRPHTGFLMADHHQKSLEAGTESKLVGIQITERGIPRAGYKIFDTEENPIGKISSGTQSPSLNRGIGLGYVKKDFSSVGQEVKIQIRDKFIPAKIVKLPFYK